MNKKESKAAVSKARRSFEIKRHVSEMNNKWEYIKIRMYFTPEELATMFERNQMEV